MIKLIRPNNEYLKSYFEAYNEENKYAPNDERIFLEPDNIVEKSKENELGINLKPGYVSSTTFWLVHNSTFIGLINIRHSLTSALLSFGGNIGYEIRYSQRNKGYGEKMLSMSLPYCKNKLKLSRVLITCYDNNIASQKMIEKNGGILENIVDHLDNGKVIKLRRYWINL